MIYVSQLLNRTIFYNNLPFAKIIDLSINEHETQPSVEKIAVEKNGKRFVARAKTLKIEKENVFITDNHLEPFTHAQNDFYLSEDLLDKQVIDIDGRRLVRVNDIELDTKDGLKVTGLDVGMGGILRRIGLGFVKVTNKVLPWKVIEAFDYGTGNIRIKLTQNSLNTFHPAELADILEDVGTKERLGIVRSLDAKQAAQAIEESDEETQVSILEGLTPQILKDILNKMHSAEIADVFHDVNPERLQEIQEILGAEKLQKVKGLSRFSDNTAGGLMHETFFSAPFEQPALQVVEIMRTLLSIPETIIVAKDRKFFGSFPSKELLKKNDEKQIHELVINKKTLTVDDNLWDIIELFSQYNLRGLPVVDKESQPIGIVLIDDVIKIIEEENQKDDSH